MCELEQTEVPRGAHHLTRIHERAINTPSLEDLEQRRLNESIEVEQYLDYLIQRIMQERT